MIDRDSALSIRRHCALLSISRLSMYYTPQGESAENLASMRWMGLGALYRKPRTSAVHLDLQVYPYLLRGLTIDRPDHVWCADTTYMPVAAGFLSLVAVMDWAGEHDGQRLLRGGTGVGASDGHAEHFQHGPGGAVYKHDVHRPGPGGDGGVLDGRPALDGAWTTGSSRDCGGR